MYRHVWRPGGGSSTRPTHGLRTRVPTQASRTNAAAAASSDAARADELTGLFNHRRFQEVMAEAMVGTNPNDATEFGDVLVFIHGYNNDQKIVMQRHRMGRDVEAKLCLGAQRARQRLRPVGLLAHVVDR